jgi:RHS repeat-associated protein
VRDYLGSVRAVYDITLDPEDVTSAVSQILEQNDYYAFGGRVEVSGQAFDQTNRYRYNGKEQLRFEGINLDPGLTDYGARYYAPAFGRWTTPDPLADKYYSVSPYAFCNNNPVNFVDPDGRRWINSLGQVVYDKNGISSYASPQEKLLIETMAKTRTGQEQLKKIANESFDVVVEINDVSISSSYGYETHMGIEYSPNTGVYTPVNSKIVIFKRMAAKRSYFLSVYEAMSVNMAHEIEHTTNDNLRLQYWKASKNAREERPREITNKITSEFYVTKPLKSIVELQQLINDMIQSDTNIHVEFNN